MVSAGEFRGPPNGGAATARNIARRADPWAELIAIARRINPDLPADLSGHEIRITLSKDFQAVEAINLAAFHFQQRENP